MLKNKLNDPILASGKCLFKEISNKSHSALLKLWFRELPHALINDSCIALMEQVAKAEPEQKINLLRQVYTHNLQGL